MIKYIILFLIILILLCITIQYKLIKIPSFDNIETFDSNTCFVKNQGELDVRMKQCNIYYTDNKDLCNSYPELYNLSIYQLQMLLININSSTNLVQYKDKTYNATILTNVINDKTENNIKGSCNFTPTNLYEIEGKDDSTNNFTNEFKSQFGCFLPLNNNNIDRYGNIKNNIISKYGNVNKTCIDNNDKTPITNITCKGANCPSSNKFHVITNFDNVRNNYNINIQNGTIFLKIYDKINVGFVKYNKNTNKLITINNNSIDVKNKFDSLYNIFYVNSSPLNTKYPKFTITNNITRSNNISISVYASSGENVFKIFDNNNQSEGWTTTSSIVTEYFNGYPGEYLKFDLGEKIVLRNFNLHPNSRNINNSPKNYRIYATNNQNIYNNLGNLITIKENNISNKIPTKINTSEYYYYAFTNTGNNNTITFLEDTLCDILIIGGGAAGSSGKGGSSSGGVIYYNDIVMDTGTYDITVGKGGVTNGERGYPSKIKNSRTNIQAVGGVSSRNVNGASGINNNINNNPADVDTVAMRGNNILGTSQTSSVTIRGGGGGAGADAENYTVASGLNYTIYDAPRGARPSFPGNGGTLRYSTPRRTGIVPYIYYNWGGGNILGYKSNNVIVHFTGYITIPGTGVKNIRFYSRVDDGIYMKINNNVILNSWVDQGPRTYNVTSENIQFNGGESYPIDIWYYENGGGAVIELYWNITGSISIVLDVFSTRPHYGQSGGDGILNNITGTNSYYAGGGSSYNDVIPSYSSTSKRGEYGYGGDSSIDSFTPGGNGIVIFRFKITYNSDGWENIFEYSPTSTMPTTSYLSTLSNLISYRYYAIVVKNNWENTHSCSISQLELFGYDNSIAAQTTISTPAIYISPSSSTKQAYVIAFDDKGSLMEYDINNVNNFSLKNNFKINQNNISDKILNSRNDNPLYGKICRLISSYINSKNNNNMTLNLSQIDAKINEYNNDSLNIGNQIPRALSAYKRNIYNDINLSSLTFEDYNNYSKLYNANFYLSNDDNIYIKL